MEHKPKSKNGPPPARIREVEAIDDFRERTRIRKLMAKKAASTRAERKRLEAEAQAAKKAAEAAQRLSEEEAFREQEAERQENQPPPREILDDNGDVIPNPEAG